MGIVLRVGKCIEQSDRECAKQVGAFDARVHKFNAASAARNQEQLTVAKRKQNRKQKLTVATRKKNRDRGREFTSSAIKAMRFAASPQEYHSCLARRFKSYTATVSNVKPGMAMAHHARQQRCANNIIEGVQRPDFIDARQLGSVLAARATPPRAFTANSAANIFAGTRKREPNPIEECRAAANWGNAVVNAMLCALHALQKSLGDAAVALDASPTPGVRGESVDNYPCDQRGAAGAVGVPAQVGSDRKERGAAKHGRKGKTAALMRDRCALESSRPEPVSLAIQRYFEVEDVENGNFIKALRKINLSGLTGLRCRFESVLGECDTFRVVDRRLENGIRIRVPADVGSRRAGNRHGCQAGDSMGGLTIKGVLREAVALQTSALAGGGDLRESMSDEGEAKYGSVTLALDASSDCGADLTDDDCDVDSAVDVDAGDASAPGQSKSTAPRPEGACSISAAEDAFSPGLSDNAPSLTALSKQWEAEGVERLRVEDCALEAGGLALLGRVLERLGVGAAACPAEGSAASAEDDEAYGEGFDLFGGAPEEGDAASAAGPAEAAAVATSKVPRAATDGCGLRSLGIVDCPGASSDAWSPFWRLLPPTLTELDLSGNALGDHAVGALCGALRPSGATLQLSLRSNRCKDVARLCGLVACGRLGALDLTDNSLNDKSAAQLAEALPSPAAVLRVLALSRNRRLTSAGLAGLAAQLPASPLRALRLDGTGLCDALDLGGLEAALPRCALDELRVDGTRLSDAGARRLLLAAQRSPGVRAVTVDEGGERLRWQRCAGPAGVLLAGLLPGAGAGAASA
ncbi:unnamed protein product [Prorocentrum cordatum]|uniref:Uncharacterized protein n=1 Tax=Prorocentrum cordatum TaxID=2364126 RepID=A0ABN9PDY6_9DINO|nr:unnamed protein product [Polarella glacialis]